MHYQILSGTHDKGITMKPTLALILEVYADADFIGNWNQSTAKYDVSTAKSSTGFLITFAECPIMWTSKL